MRELLRPLLQFVEHTSDQWTGRTPVGAERSRLWHKVRAEWLKQNPTCACCGGTSDLRVHHIVPFWVDSSLELDQENLITLCEAKRYGINCHLLLGHYGNWQKWNPTVQVMAPIWHRRIHDGLDSYVRRFIEYANEVAK